MTYSPFWQSLSYNNLNLRFQTYLESYSTDTSDLLKIVSHRSLFCCTFPCSTFLPFTYSIVVLVPTRALITCPLLSLEPIVCLLVYVPNTFLNLLYNMYVQYMWKYKFELNWIEKYKRNDETSKQRILTRLLHDWYTLLLTTSNDQ